MSDVPLNLLLKATLLTVLATQAVAWSGSSSSTQTTNYGNTMSRSWLYDGSTVSMKLEGCTWGYVEDSDEHGCMQKSSDDGTTYWYQMANCRRAQAVYSLYTGTGCTASSFKESFITTDGLSEFIYYLQKYDTSNAFSSSGTDDDSGQSYNNGKSDDLPQCEKVNGYYVGLGCSDDGLSFNLQYYADKYCLQPTGSQYDKLSHLNKELKSYKSCTKISSGSSSSSSSSSNCNQQQQQGGDNKNDDKNKCAEQSGSLATMLALSSDTCSSLDSSLCTDNKAMMMRRSHTIVGSMSRISGGASVFNGKAWVTKLKYVVAGMLLLASLIMFTGILFTNRRRRRALMQRKYRQTKSRKSSRSRSGRSKSKTRPGGSVTKSRRSKSRTRDAAESDNDGVFT